MAAGGALSRVARHLFPMHLFDDRSVTVDVNYTEEALRQMTPACKAEVVVSVCNAIMDSKGHPQYGMIETCAGIGGNTLHFATDPAIRAVVALEANHATFTMLSENMAKVKLSVYSAKTVLMNTRCTSALLQDLATKATSALGVFVDPPWGMVRPYLDVMGRGVVDPEETVADWVRVALACPAVVFVMVKVPKGYTTRVAIPGVDCFHCSKISKMDFLVYMHPANPVNSNKESCN